MSSLNDQMLREITRLSQDFGTRDYLCGGGGNSSCKDADTLWVKPSGTVLAELTPEKFVVMNRKILGELFTAAMPADPAGREAKVKDMMTAAVRPGQTARASVEAPLHHILEGRFVVHTHPSVVNGLTCGKECAAACARLFPEALWVPYVDPGFTLCVDVRTRSTAYLEKYGVPPRLILLENHGIFVAGDTADEIRETYRKVIDVLKSEYKKAGIPLELKTGKAPPKSEVESTRGKLKEAVGAEVAAIAHETVLNPSRGPLTPDHMVYAKSFPFEGELNSAGVEAFRKKRGYTPLVYLTPTGVFTIGPNQKKADLAMDLVQDGAMVIQYAAAFGGVQYLSDKARLFIENWEVESYRAKQIG